MLGEELVKEVELQEGIQTEFTGKELVMKGKKGEVKKNLFDPRVQLKVEGNKIVLSAKKPSKREKRMINTYAAHIKNMIQGANEGHVYKLKICSGHFPMNVAVNGNEISVKNYLGEKIPRTKKIKEGVSVKVNGTEIVVESTNLELAGHTASDIEQMMRITDRDRRIFQDGIYIIEKNGKSI